MTRLPASHIAFTGLLVALGGLGGALMAWLGTPLPYMLGSLAASALIVVIGQHRFPTGYEFPMKFRMIFVGVIGTMIGARLTPDVLSLLPLMLVSIPAVLVFVFGAHAVNYLIFRRLGGYDRATAYYSGSPGGLFESILFGEDAGADVRILTLMQFLRIIVVVTLVPVGMSIWEGHPVGSAAGMSFTPGVSHLLDIPVVLAIAVAGLWLGGRLRLPAAQLMGPLLVAGVLAMTGLVSIAAPGWLVAVAQVVLGTGLGIRFVGMTRSMFLRGTGLSLVSVGAMMVLGVLLAAAVHAATGLPTDMLVVSFAPGGVVEMSLIALSLAANPAIVTLHHLVRILFTVGEMSIVHKRGWLSPENRAAPPGPGLP
jgi:uncharacterized protein